MQSAFEALHAHTRAVALNLASRVADGLLLPGQFGDRMMDLLTDAHTQAVVLGRMHAGDTAPVEEDDRRFAETIVDGEAEYLSGFVKDIASGRYNDEDGEWKLGAMQRRAAMYADKLLSSATSAWTLALPEDTSLTWHLDPAAEHCGDCEELAAHSPYTPASLPTTPASGELQCVTSCRCWLTTNTGQTGFRL